MSGCSKACKVIIEKEGAPSPPSTFTINKDGSVSHNNGAPGAPGTVFGVVRADGSFLEVDPGTGLPCAAPDLTKCDETNGQAVPIAKGDSILTEENKPKSSNTGAEANTALRAYATTGQVPASASAEFGLSPIESVALTNPDLCRPAEANVQMHGFAQGDGGGAGYDGYSVYGSTFADFGDGTLGLRMAGYYAGIPGDNTHGAPNWAIGGSTTYSRWANTAEIPPGGTITLRVQSQYQVLRGHLDNINAITAAQGSTFGGEPKFRCISELRIGRLESICQ